MLPSLVPHAEAYKCDPYGVNATFPEDGARDVPVDVVPLAWVGAGGCDGSNVEWEATLARADTGEVVASIPWNMTNLGELVELDPDDDLAPDADWRWSLEPTGTDVQGGTVGFVTGSDVAPVLTSSPVLEGLTATWGRQYVWLVADVTPGEVAGESFVILESGDTLTGASIVLSNPGPIEGQFRAADKPDEACVVVRQRDFAGTWAESDERCAEVQCECGSGVGVVPPFLALLLLRRATARSSGSASWSRIS